MTIDGVSYAAGSPVNVVYDTLTETAVKSYLQHTTDEDLQTLTLNDFTYITNRTKPVAMSTDKSPVKPSEAFIQLKKVAYANQYAVNLFDNNTTQDVTTATRISILSSKLDTDGTCPNVGTEILNVGTGSDYAFDIKNEFIFKALHGNHEGANNFFETDLTLGYQLHYCPPEWTANTFYRPGDLVTGRPDSSNNNAHQSVYKLKAGSKSDYSKSDGSTPTHDGTTGNEEVTVATENGDGTSTANGHTWVHVSVEIYEADNNTFEDTSGSGSGATSQTYHNKPCITLSTSTAGLDVDSQADFEALIAEWKNTTINPGYTHLPFVFDDQENFNESATQNHAGYTTETAEFGIIWKHFGYYDDHLDRIILERPGGNGPGHTIGGSTVDLVKGVGQLELKTEGWSTDDTVKEGRSDLYFRLNVTGQAVPTTTGTGSDATTTYSCRYTTTVDLLHGGSGWQVGDKIRVPLKDGSHVIQVDKISTSKVQANLGLIRPTPTSFDTKTTVTAESILGDLQTDIIAASTAWTAWPSSETASSTGVKIIGNGLYIRRSDNTNPFNITTPAGELLNVLSDEVKDIADLPEQCRHGYVVKVANSENDEDDYYVKFIGQEKADGTFLDGKGTWQECIAPDQEYKYDKATMPVTLIRTTDGNFRVAQLDGVLYYNSQEDATCEITDTNEITVTLTNHGYSVGDSVTLSEDADDLFSGPLPLDTYIVTKVESANKFSVESSNITGTNLNYTQQPITGNIETYAFPYDDHGILSQVDDYYVKFNTSSGTLPTSGNDYTLKHFADADVFYITTIPPNADDVPDDDSTGTATIYNKNIKVAHSHGYHPKWEDALVGVTVADGTGTNPRASFVGKTINNMLFFRNRLVMLSDENVIMSQPGDFFNFWAKSAITYGNTDMIDISCSSEFPAIVYDGIQVNSGLVLFTKNQQFMLTTDSDLLNPLTAKINSLSTYNFNFKTNPFSLGTTIGFLDNAGKYNRFWEMTAVLREGDPNVIEQSKTISKRFPNDIDMVANSRENQVVFFGKKGTSTVYGFRYHTDAASRIQQAWFEWELRGTIQHIAVLDDALYVVLKNSERTTTSTGLFDVYHIEKFEITAEDPFVISSDFDVHLDKSVKANANGANLSGITVDSNNVALTNFYNDPNKLVAYQIDGTAGDIGKVYTVDSVIAYGSNFGVTFNAAPTGNIIVGYKFETEVELPKIYLQQKAGDSFRSDIQSSLTVQRLKLNFGDLGTCTTTLNRKGKTALTTTHEAKPITSSVAAAPFIESEETLTIPVYEKNKNVTITIKSEHPSPSTLHSMNWEGAYTNKYYQRV